MYRVEEALSRILGIKPAFMRPPFGAYNGNVQSIAAGRGQNLALWDWDTEDADGATVAFSKNVYDQIASQKPKNALVLEHETVRQFNVTLYSSSTLESNITFAATTSSQLIPYAIQLFQSKGYNASPFFFVWVFSKRKFQLVTMAECLGVAPYQAIGVPQTQSVGPPHRIRLYFLIIPIVILDM
jgi:hypothetical protein